MIVVALILKGERNRKRKRKRISIDTFAKLMVSLVVAHGMILTTMSYILSFYGLDPVVDVSSTIVRGNCGSGHRLSRNQYHYECV